MEEEVTAAAEVVAVRAVAMVEAAMVADLRVGVRVVAMVVAAMGVVRAVVVTEAVWWRRRWGW